MIAEIARDVLDITDVFAPYLHQLPLETRARIQMLSDAIAEDLAAGRYCQAREKRVSLDLIAIFWLPDEVTQPMFGLPRRRRS